MATRKVSSKLILVFIDVGVVLGMILGYRNYNVDRLSLLPSAFCPCLCSTGYSFWFERASLTFRQHG